MRWEFLRLEEYDYEIEYKKGKENTAADALSRLYPMTNEEIQSDLENPNYYDECIDWTSSNNSKT